MSDVGECTPPKMGSEEKGGRGGKSGKRSRPSRMECSYCNIDFDESLMSKKEDGLVLCRDCNHYLAKHGEPSLCAVCARKCAFGKEECAYCRRAMKEYGHPTRCQHCKETRAFNKGLEARKKVNYLTLCILCTRKIKIEIRKKEKLLSKVQEHALAMLNARAPHLRLAVTEKEGEKEKGEGREREKGEQTYDMMDVDAGFAVSDMSPPIIPHHHDGMAAMWKEKYLLKDEKLTKAREKISQLENEKVQMEARCKELETSLCQIELSYRQLEADQGGDEMAKQQKMNEKLKAEVHKLQAENAQLRRGTFELKQKLMGEEAKRDNLKQEWSTRYNNAVTRNQELMQQLKDAKREEEKGKAE
mmetsp:Transcript_22836/g.58115  ORF Transcript_22836/g.58115 Transcript_22836/m.58115 type:complete len:359 (-) Transcript_22836:67-1143(-)